MKYLVTGGAGFIGSHLIELLVENNHQVICIDDLSTGHMSNLSSIINKIEFYKERIGLFDFHKVHDINAIVHLAAQPSVPLSITNFSNSSSSNILGTINVINYCRVKEIPLIYASSSAVYGDLTLGNDESKEIDLLSPYATDKYAMELYAKTAYKLYQLSSVGLRFFNVYGPRQDPGSPYSGVISIFADRMLKGQNITINGGCQTRDFVHVRDVVDIIYRAISLASSGIVCEVSNVLTGKSVTIDHLSSQMMDVVGINIDKIYQDLSKGDPEQSDGTVEKMIRLFSIEISSFLKLREGLQETIQYIKNDK
jgi:UDP-glucose 4-epimerase